MEAVILVGHGGLPADVPKGLVEELKRLEGQRRARGAAEMGPREAEVDGQIRRWPRTPESDPYRAGLEALAERLRARLDGKRLVTAYNEFCTPSVEEAIDGLAADGAKRITLVTTMFTRGGVHSEVEIPGIVRAARKRHPGLEISYRWPFDGDLVADFLARHLEGGKS